MNTAAMPTPALAAHDPGVFDGLRCDISNPANPVSRSVPPVVRDCNVLGFGSVPVGQNPGSLPTVVSANPNLKPETSKSMTLGLVCGRPASAHQAPRIRVRTS